MPDCEKVLASVLLQMAVKEFELAYEEIESAFDMAPRGLTQALIEQVSGLEDFDHITIKDLTADKAGEEAHDELLHTGYFELIEKVIVGTYVAGLGDSVEQCLERLDPLFPNGGATYLAVCSYLKGAYGVADGALADAEAAVKLEPGNVLARYNRAVSLGAHGLAEEAAELVNGLIGEGYDSTGMRASLASVYVLKDEQKALEVIEDALKRDPGNLYANSVKMGILVKLGKMDLSLDSVMEFTRGIEETPLSSPGARLYEECKYEEAVDALRKELEENPFDDYSWDLLAKALQILGRFDEALKASEEAIRLQPARTDYVITAAHTHLAAGDLDQGLKSFDRAIAVNPEDALLYYDKSDALVELDMLDEAMEAAEKGVSLAPDDTFLLSNAARIRMARGEYEEALGHCEAALALEPDDDILMFDAVLALEALKRHEEALDRLEAILDVAPLANYYGHYARTYMELDRPEEALEVLERALAEDPGNAALVYAKVDAFRMMERWEDAWDAYRTIQELEPEEVQDNPGRGYVLWMLGRTEEALKEFDLGLEFSPNDVYTLQMKAGLLGETGRFEEALEVLAKAREVEPDDPETVRLENIVREEMAEGN